MNMDTTREGLSYDWKVGGPWDTEAICVLYRRPGFTDAQIEDAKQEISWHVDVYAFEVVEPKSGGYAEDIIKDAADYDAIEVHGVRDIAPPEVAADGSTICEVDDDNPQFFSVYVHLVQGGVECIGDFETRTGARDYALRIHRQFGWTVFNYVDSMNEPEHIAGA
jgi:hypothetical protein